MEYTDIQIAKKMIAKERNAKERGIEFDMTFTMFKNLMRAKKCYYTQAPLTDNGEVVCEPTRRTIDRIDHKQGYVKGNVVACSHAYNQFKNEMEKTGIIGEEMFQKAVVKTFNVLNKSRGKKATYKKER